MQPLDRRRAGPLAAAVGAAGLLLALANEADVGLSSGLWYPVVYAGAPSIATTLVLLR